MQYLGGKSSIAADLTEVIKSRHSERSLAIEPFCGGGAMTVALAGIFDKVSAYDLHPDLIRMWQALRDGWIPPDNVTEMEYSDLSYASPSALRAFVGFNSYAGKWFGGYPRNEMETNYFQRSKNVLLNDIAKMQNVEFNRSDFSKIIVPSGAVVYADPPYSGTTKYSETFSAYRFWFFVKKWAAAGATVYVSEYKAPPGVPCIWEQTIHGKMKEKKIVEKLFVMEPESA